MKAYYVLSIVAAGLISTVVGSNLVAAGTTSVDAPAATSVTAPESLERLKAQAETGAMTWRRPL